MTRSPSAAFGGVPSLADDLLGHAGETGRAPLPPRQQRLVVLVAAALLVVVTVLGLMALVAPRPIAAPGVPSAAQVAAERLSLEAGAAAETLSGQSAAFGVVVAKMPTDYLRSELMGPTVTEGSHRGVYKVDFETGSACLTFDNHTPGLEPDVRLSGPDHVITC